MINRVALFDVFVYPEDSSPGLGEGSVEIFIYKLAFSRGRRVLTLPHQADQQ